MASDPIINPHTDPGSIRPWAERNNVVDLLFLPLRGLLPSYRGFHAPTLSAFDPEAPVHSILVGLSPDAPPSYAQEQRALLSLVVRSLVETATQRRAEDELRREIEAARGAQPSVPRRLPWLELFSSKPRGASR